MQDYLTHIVDYLLAQSWQIAVLTVAVAVATFALRNRSAHIRYLLWLIVLAKCLVPPLYSVPVGILPPETLADGRSFAPLPEMFANVTEVGDPAEAPTDTTRAEPAKPGTTSAGTSVRASVARWLAIAWLAGVGVYLLMNALRALRANFWLRKKRQALPAKLQTDIQELFAAYHLKRFPKIYLIDGMSQPFVWGVLRGSIYLPADFANVNNPAHRRNVLGHELSHVLRFDAAVNLLQVVAQAIFWFHPFVWWANRKIRAEREKCCDEMAISRLNALPRDYSTAIVETLSVRNKSTRPVPSLAVAGPVKNIEERIRTMLRPGKKFYKRPSLVAATVAMVIALFTVPTALMLTARAEIESTVEQESKSTQSLHEAAKRGDIEQVKLLISSGGDVNSTDEKGRTPLHYAGRIEIAQLLIEAGADVNAKDNDGATPLHVAGGSPRLAVVELLISKGADINAKTKDGLRPVDAAMVWEPGIKPPRYKRVVELLIAKGAQVSTIHLAAYLGNVQKLKECLEQGVHVDTKGVHQRTPLHFAADQRQMDVVELLLAAGADVNAQDGGGSTPLHCAAWAGRKEVAELLIAKGADVNSKDKYGCTPFVHTFPGWPHPATDIQRLLIDKGADVHAKDLSGFTLLHYSVMLGNIESTELLLSKGAEVDLKGPYGATPLDWACLHGKAIGQLLVEKGAEVSSLQSAALIGDFAKVKTFLDAGVDVNAKNAAGVSALYAAANGGHKQIVELLLAKGADIINAQAQPYSRLLGAAVSGGSREVVELLISKGVDVNAVVHGRGRTALHGAAGAGRTDIVVLLVAKGLDVNAKDWEIWTPLHYACWQNHRETVEFLLTKGADLNAKDGDGNTPLAVAKEAGHTEIVELLRQHGAKE